MDLLVLSGADVHPALSYADGAEAMRAAFLALANGEAQMPLRTVTRPAGAVGLVALVPAILAPVRLRPNPGGVPDRS